MDNNKIAGDKIKDELIKRFNLKADEISHHESDLYIKYREEIDIFLKENYKWYKNITTFTSQIDNKRWFDIPFAFGAMFILYILK